LRRPRLTQGCSANSDVNGRYVDYLSLTYETNYNKTL